MRTPSSTRLASTALAAMAMLLLAGLGGCGDDNAGGGAGGSGSGGTAGKDDTGGSGSGGRVGTGGSGAGGSSNGSGGSGSGGSGTSSTGGTGGCNCLGGTYGRGGTTGNAGAGGTTTDAGAGDASPDASKPDGTNDQGSQGETGGAETPAGTAAVQLAGRFDKYESTPAKFGWVGSAMIARFNGTGATIQLDGSDDRYQVVVDGTPSTTILKVTSSGKFQVAKGLTAGTHDLVVWRRSESNWSTSSYLGIEIDGGQLLAPPARPERRIEIFGDSITAGYGLDGQGPSCSMSQDNSNHYLTYGALTARKLSAELHTVAWSGIGMYRNYGQTAPAADTLNMPKVYARTMPSVDGAWDFSQWKPHAVVINLGTNDASSNGDPGTPYRTAYLDFVRGLRQKYPDTFFVLTIGPMLDGTALTAIRTHLQAVIQARASEGDTKMSYLEFPTQTQADGYGCDWHPSPKTNSKMADLLVAELKKQLSW
jgi:lysophospholipase L1-like esterase